MDEAISLAAQFKSVRENKILSIPEEEQEIIQPWLIKTLAIEFSFDAHDKIKILDEELQKI